MKSFEITVEWTMTATVKVEADSQEEAIRKAEELPLPTEGDYMGDTYRVLAVNGDFI